MAFSAAWRGAAIAKATLAHMATLEGVDDGTEIVGPLVYGVVGFYCLPNSFSLIN